MRISSCEEHDAPALITAGSDVPAGRYRCTNCSTELLVASGTQLPRCPECRHEEFQILAAD